MRKYYHKISNQLLGLAVVGVLATSSLLGTHVFASSYQGQISNAKDKKQELEKKKKDLEKKLGELEAEKDNVLVYIEKLDKELSTVTDDIDKLTDEITSVNNDLTKTEKKLKKAIKQEETQYETMKKRIQYMYENGDTSLIEVLLSSNNLAELLNQVEYVSEIVDYDNSLLDRYQDTKKQVEEMKSQLEDTLEEKNLLNDELTVNQEMLEGMLDSKQKELAKYEKSISSTEKMSSEYQQQIAEQEDMIEDLLEKERQRIEEERKRKEEEERKRREEEERKRKEEEAQKQENSSNNNSSNTGSSNNNSNSNVSTSGFLWPVPASGRITCGFGYRNSPTAGASTYHKGIDIGASTGAKIVAVKSGTVVTASYNVAAGNYIMISHGDGVYSVYMHCSKLLVSTGQSVQRGDTIALVGSTGVSTGPHLHFGISINGSYVDPRKYVSP